MTLKPSYKLPAALSQNRGSTSISQCSMGGSLLDSDNNGTRADNFEQMWDGRRKSHVSVTDNTENIAKG